MTMKERMNIFYSMQRSPRLVAGAATLLLVMLFSASPGCALREVAQKPESGAEGCVSIEALAQAVLAAMALRDEAHLQELEISEPEFRQYIWPYLPVAAIPAWQEKYSFVWDQHSMKSRRGLRRVLNHFGGRIFKLVEVRFRGEVSRYGDCRVHRDARLLVRTDGDEAPTEIKLFGSVVEIHGRYKVMSYNVK